MNNDSAAEHLHAQQRSYITSLACESRNESLGIQPMSSYIESDRASLGRLSSMSVVLVTRLDAYVKHYSTLHVFSFLPYLHLKIFFQPIHIRPILPLFLASVLVVIVDSLLWNSILI